MQTQLSLPSDYVDTQSYKKAQVIYNKIKDVKHLQPVFLCYCKSTKDFFVSQMFSKKFIDETNIKILTP